MQRAIVLSIFGGAALASPLFAAAPVADLVIQHGKVYTADGSGNFAQAVAVKDGYILAVGQDAEIARLRGPKTKVIDARGAAVTPGLIDTHTHLVWGAAWLEQAQVSGVRSGADLAQRLRAFAAAHPTAKVIQGAGYFPDSITRFDIDDAADGRPIVVSHGDGHRMLLNGAALAMAGLSDRDPPNPTMPRDAKGRLTGVLMEGAQAKAELIIPKQSEADQRHLLALATDQAHAAGLTTVVVVGGQDDLKLFERARAANTLSLRVAFAQWLTRDDATGGFPHDFTFDEHDADKLDAIRRNFHDDPMLHFDMVKIMSDGVIENHTAAELEPYADQPDNRGDENYSKADLDRIVGMMDRRGWQIMLHALGDRAVRWALDSFELAAKNNKEPADGRRHKIEHIENVNAADIPRFGQLNVTASIQPAHGLGMSDPKRSGQRWRNLGYLRSAWGFPWKSVTDAGGRVAFGSDWPVAPLNIGTAAYSATNRIVNPPVPDQRLTMPAVIDGYTRNAAYSIFRDKDLGTLQPGKRADIVIFGDDIFTVPSKRADFAVRTTFLDGKVVYCAAGADCGGE